MAKKKQEEITETPAEVTETAADEAVAAEMAAAQSEAPVEAATVEKAAAPKKESAGEEAPVRKGDRGNRAQKVGTVSSDKMMKTCVVRVDRSIHLTERGVVADELHAEVVLVPGAHALDLALHVPGAGSLAAPAVDHRIHE